MTTEPKGATADGQSGLNAKQRILTAALELFDEDGYEGTTVDAIVRRAGVSRRLFSITLRRRTQWSFRSTWPSSVELRHFWRGRKTQIPFRQWPRLWRSS